MRVRRGESRASQYRQNQRRSPPWGLETDPQPQPFGGSSITSHAARSAVHLLPLRRGGTVGKRGGARVADGHAAAPSDRSAATIARQQQHHISRRAVGLLPPAPREEAARSATRRGTGGGRARSISNVIAAPSRSRGGSSITSHAARSVVHLLHLVKRRHGRQRGGARAADGHAAAPT